MVEGRPKASVRRQAEAVRRCAARRFPLASLTLAAWAPRWMTSAPQRVVSGYWPFRDEMDPRPLMFRFEAAGARLALPVTPQKGAGAPLTFRAWRRNDPLQRSEFGVMEPTPDAAAVIPDLLLVPLLAFDRLGGRLGYGAGHYDRTLADLRSVRSIFALGVGFAVQEMAVPSEAHDQSLDAVVTERGYWLMEPSFP